MAKDTTGNVFPLDMSWMNAHGMVVLTPQEASRVQQAPEEAKVAAESGVRGASPVVSSIAAPTSSQLADPSIQAEVDAMPNQYRAHSRD